MARNQKDCKNMLELLVELTKYAGQTNKQTNPILSHDIPFLEVEPPLLVYVLEKL